MFEQLLISSCAPTLAGIKTANMFSCPIRFTKEAFLLQRIWTPILNEKGISIRVFQVKEKKALFYVYRPKRLEKDFENPLVMEFLKDHGYQQLDLEYCLKRLQMRMLQGEKFPHEIGLFLSYPIEDVVGFVKHGGQNSKCVGCWKVYENECEKVKIFAKYKKCRLVYTQLFLEGKKTLPQLVIAA